MDTPRAAHHIRQPDEPQRRRHRGNRPPRRPRLHPHHRDRLPPRTTTRHHHRRPDHGPALHSNLTPPALRTADDLTVHMPATDRWLPDRNSLSRATGISVQPTGRPSRNATYPPAAT